jgi:hypothetical protein
VPMIEVSEIRKRLRQRLEQVKRENAERRTRADAAARAYDTFIADTATPVFRMFASALKAESYPFNLFTPGGGLRLMSERSSNDFIELFLDTETDPPIVAARVNRGRGRRLVTAEHPLREDTRVEQLTDQDVTEFLLRELMPFLER